MAIKRARSARASKRSDEQRSDEQSEQAPASAETEWVDVRSLRPWPGNPKSYTDEEVAELAASVKVNGWGRPGVANRYKGLEGEIIEGHRTRLAALSLGDTVVPGAPGPYLVPFRWVHLPAKRAHALALAATRIPKSELDDAKMKELARSHELDPLDWLTAGFAENEIRALMFDPWPESGEKKAGKPGADDALSYQVIIECRDESQQTEILEWCEQQGIAGKPWVG